MRRRAENLGGLRRVECVLPDAGLVVVTGANGAGKSTMLRAVAGMLAGVPNPAGLSPAMRNRWLGRDGATPTMSLSGGDWSVEQTGDKLSTDGEVAPSHPFAVGLVDVLEMPRKQQVEVLERMLVPQELVREVGP